MKKITVLSLSLLVFSACSTTDNQSVTDDASAICCSNPTADFAALGSDKMFVNRHENPIPSDYRGDLGKNITFKTSDGQKANAYEIKAAKKSDKYLLVFHEWWGLNGYIRKEAEKFYKDLDNVNIIAVDMYDGKVTDQREEAAKLMQGVKIERVNAILEGIVSYAGKKAKIATVGWCFGGGMSLQSSLATAEKGVACVIYYGMPEKNIDRLKTLNADVLGIFASQEQWISPEVVKEFEENMAKANKKLMVRSFEADHAFANPSNPKYNEQFAMEAYQLSLSFIKDRLNK